MTDVNGDDDKEMIMRDNNDDGGDLIFSPWGYFPPLSRTLEIGEYLGCLFFLRTFVLSLSL